MISRNAKVDKINRLLTVFPITAIIGPRQCGKTTLANQISQPFEKFR